ncbi:hypothetical protein [Saccharolobus islandicus]|uniref:Uncharacterized protein n=1 Tax=Saccharolobus islandicus (strain M.16.27) TaxID=427318 RepID=C3N608_SACI3|nr:hypothetical protein [Sulfolobus islandicus]ACP55433.1 hypothetical protein M1627_1549 [Sulfolobus islandicus M.16.27]
MRREEDYRSPFYYNMDPYERMIHDNADPYMAENMYWQRKSMEIINNPNDPRRRNYYTSRPSRYNKDGLIASLIIIGFFFLMLIAYALSNMPHYP